jgi:transcriptional regulator with XRE-family HTH domain
MARAALGWGVRDLGARAGVSPNTVSRFENGFGALVETLVQIQETLEQAGIVFISPDERGGPGVRLRDLPTKKKKRKR